jgi:hypothetical protein
MQPRPKRLKKLRKLFIRCIRIKFCNHQLGRRAKLLKSLNHKHSVYLFKDEESVLVVVPLLVELVPLLLHPPSHVHAVPSTFTYSRNVPLLYAALQRKSHLCIPRKGIGQLQSRFPHSCVCERFIYSQDWSTYFPAAEYSDLSWEYINHSKTHEYGNWD